MDDCDVRGGRDRRTAGTEIQDFRVNKRRVLKGLLGPMWHIYDRWHAKPRTIR